MDISLENVTRRQNFYPSIPPPVKDHLPNLVPFWFLKYPIRKLTKCCDLLFVLVVLKGVVLRPGFIYGKRKVNGIEVPLDLVGEPLDKIYDSAERFIRPLRSLPASDLILAPPVNVDDLALAVINAVKDDDFFGIFTIEQIKEAAAKMRA